MRHVLCINKCSGQLDVDLYMVWVMLCNSHPGNMLLSSWGCRACCTELLLLAVSYHIDWSTACICLGYSRAACWKCCWRCIDSGWRIFNRGGGPDALGRRRVAACLGLNACRCTWSGIALTLATLAAVSDTGQRTLVTAPR